MKGFVRISIIALAASSLAAVSCAKWTRPESLDFRRETPEAADPAAYERHLDGVRAYKASEHKVMLVTMDAPSGRPSRQNQHLMAMPDSADFICVNIGDGGIHPSVAEEIAQVRSRKGTRVLAHVNFSVIDEAWLDMKNTRNDAGEPAPTEEECREWFRSHAETQLAFCDRYGLDGVVASFEDVLITEEDRLSEAAFFSAVKEWRASHGESLMFLRGNVNLMSDRELCNAADCYILVMGGQSGVANYKSKLRSALRAIDRKDRNLFELSVPSAGSTEQYGDSPYDAAGVILSDDIVGYTPYGVLGLAVSNAQDDYYNDSYYEAGDLKKENPVHFGNFVNVRRGIDRLAAGNTDN